MKDALPPSSSPPRVMEAPPPYAPTEAERNASDSSSNNLSPNESGRRKPGVTGIIGHRGSGEACCSIDSGSGCMNIRSDDGCMNIESESGCCNIRSENGCCNIRSSEGCMNIQSDEGCCNIRSEAGCCNINQRGSDGCCVIYKNQDHSISCSVM